MALEKIGFTLILLMLPGSLVTAAQGAEPKSVRSFTNSAFPKNDQRMAKKLRQARPSGFCAESAKWNQQSTASQSKSDEDQEDCSFSQEGQLEALRNVGSRYPGGKTDVKERVITWVSENGTKTVFSYGGCADLGSEISVTSKMKTPRSRQAVLATALALGERFWTKNLIYEPLALPMLKEGIRRNRFAIEKINGSTLFNIQHGEAFAEFYIEHTYKEGLDTVSVVWGEN